MRDDLRLYQTAWGDHVNILLLTKYCPLPEDPMGGTFIQKRLEKLRQYGINFDAFTKTYDERALFKISRIMRNKSRPDPLKDIDFIESAGIRFNYIHIPIGLLQALSVHINPLRLARIYAEHLSKRIEPEKYDLIHAHCVYPEGYVACLIKERYDLPCVLTAHGSDIHTLPYTQPELKSAILKTLESAGRVIFVSNALLRKAMELGYAGENAVVIPNGVDIPSFPILDRTEMRKRNGIYEVDTHYVGFVGNLVQVKRVDRLPEIFLSIKREIPNVKFIVVGDGDLKDAIEKKFIAHDLDVIFTGLVKPEMVSLWMNCMDCLVLPSRNEGWGIVVLEAQACGVPVVGSNAGGIPEAVGEGGRIVEDGDDFEERFSEAVRSILRDPPDPGRLRERALEYDWENIIQKEVDVYQSLLR